MVIVFRRNIPCLSSTRFSLMCANHAGCVQSPVATISIPLRAHHASITGNSSCFEHAREYFEWMCQSTIVRIRQRFQTARRQYSCSESSAR